jgi:hypothetical protein
MSKKDKRNQNIDSPESEFNRIVDEFSASVDKMTQEFDQKSEPLIDDSDESEEDIQWFRFLSVFPFLFRKTIGGVVKTASFGYFLAQKAVRLPLRIVSFFKSKMTRDTEGEKESPENISQPKKQQAIPNQPATKTVTAGNPANEEYDEDENIGFHWMGLTIKAASAAAVVLLITGGYFGVKSFLGQSKTDSGVI